MPLRLDYVSFGIINYLTITPGGLDQDLNAFRIFRFFLPLRMLFRPLTVQSTQGFDVIDLAPDSHFSRGCEYEDKLIGNGIFGGFSLKQDSRTLVCLFIADRC